MYPTCQAFSCVLILNFFVSQVFKVGIQEQIVTIKKKLLGTLVSLQKSNVTSVIQIKMWYST